MTLTDKQLENISVDELRKALKKKEKPEPLFVKNGVEYYDVDRYNQLLKYYDTHGVPTDFSPMEFNRDGSAKVAEPKQVVINLNAYLANLVYIKGNEYHVVLDTRSIREHETGDVTITVIPEYVLTPNPKAKGGFDVVKGNVTRENFLKYYTESFGTRAMLSILKEIESDQIAIDEESQLTLDVFNAKPKNRNTAKTRNAEKNKEESATETPDTATEDVLNQLVKDAGDGDESATKTGK